MNFKEWIKLDEAAPGARSTSPSGINLAIPTHYSTYGGQGEIDYYARQNPALAAAAHVARGGIGAEVNTLAQRSGLRIASAIGMEPPKLKGEIDKVVAIALPLQTNTRMADGSKSQFENLGYKKDMLVNIWGMLAGNSPNPQFKNAIVRMEDVGTKDPNKFAAPDEKDLADRQNAIEFTKFVAQVMAYQKMLADPKVDMYDLDRIGIRDSREDNGVLVCSFVFPKKK